MKTKTVQLFRTVTVTELPLGKYAELLVALNQLPRHFDKFTTLKQEDLLPELPKIIGESIDDFVKIVVISTDLSEDEVRTEIGVAGLTQIVLAAIEVNDYSAAWTNLKKMFAHPTPKSNSTGKSLPTGSTTQ